MGKKMQTPAGIAASACSEGAGKYHASSKAAPSGLAGALFTTTQQRVLGALFGPSQRSFTVSELIATTGSGSGAVQRELAKLSASGLLTMHRVGNQKHYQANPAAPIHNELVAIVQKTVGLSGPLYDALAPFAENIEVAFVYGSLAKRDDTSASDIDLMVISDRLNYGDLMLALDPLVGKLGREINPTIYTRTEFNRRQKSGNPFIMKVLGQPKLWLIGSDDAFGT